MRAFLQTLNPLALFGLRREPDRVPTPAQVESNMRHLVGDLLWYGVMIGTAVNFMQVYVVRLGAPSLLVGAVTYGPALINMLWQMPAARLVVRTGGRMRWILGASIVHRSFVLLIALVPFLFTQGRAEITVLLLILQALPVALSATSFLSMMADAVPPDRIPVVVSARMAGYGVSVTLSALLAGQVLTRLPFPLNYQVLFMIGFAAALISQWHVSQLCVPDRPPERGKQAPLWQDLGRVVRTRRFTRYAVAVACLQVALGMLSPLLALFWVRSLRADDVQISVVLTIYSATSVLGSLLMRRLVPRIGRERTLTYGTLGFMTYPLLTSFAPSIWWVVAWAAVGGVFLGSINVTLFDNLVAATPEVERTTYLAVYNMFVNGALFIGPLLAALLSRSAGGPGVGLQVAAGVVVLAGVLFLLWLRPRPPVVVTAEMETE